MVLAEYLFEKQGLLIIVLFWSAIAYTGICVLSCTISSVMELYTSCSGGGSALPRTVSAFEWCISWLFLMVLLLCLLENDMFLKLKLASKQRQLCSASVSELNLHLNRGNSAVFLNHILVSKIK